MKEKSKSYQTSAKTMDYVCSVEHPCQKYPASETDIILGK